MKSIWYNSFGSPDVLELREVPRPEPKSDEVLVRILATSVNKADWHLLNGKPFPVRLMGGLTKPKYPILGADIAGIVERVGRDITQFRPGDEVFGNLSECGFGGFAEYATAKEHFLAKKPSNLTYEAAAALPMAATTALQGLRDKGRIQEHQQVLINGASGGVGSYAVQIAKYYGAQVTAVCSAEKAKKARQNGADTVIDYQVQDFTKSKKQHQLIFDVVGNQSLAVIRKVLAPKGTYVTCAFSIGTLFQGPWMRLLEGKKAINLLANTRQADLQFLSKLAEEGHLNPVIQQSFTLDDVPEALHIIGKGHAAGKLVIAI